jgi:hypothetical protein
LIEKWNFTFNAEVRIKNPDEVGEYVQFHSNSEDKVELKTMQLFYEEKLKILARIE